MRERVKGLMTSIPVECYVNKYSLADQLLIHDAYQSVKTSSTIQKIIDDPSPMAKPRVTRNVAHYKCDAKGLMVTQEWYDQPSNPTAYYRGYYAINPDTSNLVFPDVSSYHNEALQFFKAGCVDQEFDLAADLFEWKQVRSLIPDLASNIRSVFSGLRHKNFKSLVKGSANTNLAYSFGIKPLISDVTSLISCVKGMEDKISFLRKNSGSVVPVRFRKDISQATRPATRIDTDNPNALAYLRTVDYRALYTAFALITYDVSKLSDIELKLRYFTRSLGLDKPLSTLWELTPWSFVVDWVVDIGKWIDELTPSISIPYKVQDLGYSIKVSRTDEYVVTRKIPKTNPSVSILWSRSAYFRQRGIPASFSSMDLGDVSLRKLVLSASLAAQRWR